MIKELLHQNIVESLENLKLSHEKEFTIEIPNNTEFGDYSTNAALVLGKENKLKPKQLAEQIVKELKKNKAYKKLEIAGPGFINFFLSPSLFQQVFWEIYKSEDYGKSDFGNQEKVLLEFVSANPTGPLNIVSARAAAFGDTLYRIMKYVCLLYTSPSPRDS